MTRPGGTALNAGQVGAFRASEFIAARYREQTVDDGVFRQIAEKELAVLETLCKIPAKRDWKQERAVLQHRMSEAGAFIRSQEKVTAALEGAYKQSAALLADGLGGLTPRDFAETLRNRQLLTAQIFYLESILMQIDHIGSRGGSIVLAKEGVPIHPKLGEVWRMAAENKSYRNQVMQCGYGANGYPEISWEPCRPVPETDGWFENVWNDFRNGTIYGGRK